MVNSECLKMSPTLILVVLFQLSALVPNLLGQATFPANDGFYQGTGEGRSYGLWNPDNNGFGQYPYAPRDLDQQASFNVPRDSDAIYNQEFLTQPDALNDFPNADIGRGRQFPFFFPNQFYPGFPLQQQQQLPQLPPPFFNFPQHQPWWQGDNVCVVKDESTDDWTGNEVGLASQPDYSINLQACSETKNQYICKTTTNRGGKKLTTVTTRGCCKGYARFPQRQGPNAGCVKVKMVSFMEAAKMYGYPDFTSTLKQANITQDQIDQSTLLLPLRLENDSLMNMDVDNETSMEMDNWAENSILPDDILEYLIPNKTIDLEEIENETVVKTENGHIIRFNVYPRANNNVSDYEYRYHYTANCVPVVKPKIFAKEGMVLGLAKQLIVAETTLMDMLRDREDLSMFTQMVDNFNLTDILEHHDSITVLAPNDMAFSNMSEIEQRMLLSGDECASEYVANHLLGLTLCSSAVVKNARAQVKNLQKHTLSFEREANDQIIINGHSRSAEMDLMATNGVMHVLDQALPSDKSMTVLSLLMNRNSTIFAELIMKSGFEEQFEDLRGATFFAPTNKAMQNSPWKTALDNNSTSLMKNQTLYDFLSNHISGSVIGSHEFRTGFVKTMAKQELKMNSMLNHPSSGTTLNCARFVSTDGVSCNRAIHQIDRALDLPTMSLLEALEANKDYSKFLGIIKGANLTHLISNETRDVTLLVPTNDVFEEQKEYYEELSRSHGNLEPFIKMHMVLNSVCCSAFPQYPVINTVQSANGISLVVSRQRRPMIGNAHITKCDIVLKNGLIFEVNDIIEFKATVQRSPVFK